MVYSTYQDIVDNLNNIHKQYIFIGMVGGPEPVYYRGYCQSAYYNNYYKCPFISIIDEVSGQSVSVRITESMFESGNDDNTNPKVITIYDYPSINYDDNSTTTITSTDYSDLFKESNQFQFFSIILLSIILGTIFGNLIFKMMKGL